MSVASWVQSRLSSILPILSATEREALEAGSPGYEARLLSGRFNQDELLQIPLVPFTHEEKAFLEREVVELCRHLTEWEIQKNLDLPPQAWDLIRNAGFMGLCIPKEYGGKGFSARAHAEVVARIAAVSPTAAITVMVPNSLGPAELILHYGTDEQRDVYLPRLATGKEIPCFALTSPWAGSDAASIPDAGVVCLRDWNGVPTLGLALTLDKRYITLAPVATLVGVAFRVRDPDNLLGMGQTPGITLALVPSHVKGLELGKRHFPMGASFMNGTVRAQDSFIPLEYVIGGEAGIGKGWLMLMECLAAGRGISLPATASTSCSHALLAAVTYSGIRQQFGRPIADFHAVGRVISDLGINALKAEATRTFFLAQLAQGERPSVASAILKSHLTEMARQSVNGAMDILAGKAISDGPSNPLLPAYRHIPIGITVEGANLLTRGLIVFGQGAFRCHPYLLKEIQALEKGELFQLLRLLLRHFVHFNGSLARYWLGWLGRPWHKAHPKTEIARLSAALSVCTEFALMTLGGKLKRYELLSMRLGDALAELYMASSLVWYLPNTEARGDLRDLQLLAIQEALTKAERYLVEFIRNHPTPWVRAVLHLVMPGLGWLFPNILDDLRLRAVAALRGRGPALRVLTAHVHVRYDESDPLRQLLTAHRLNLELKCNTFKKDSAEETEAISKLARLRQKIIAVDEFSSTELS